MDLKIGSINVRGLGDNQKEEKFLTGLRQRISQFTFFEMFTVLKVQHLSGRPNGDMKPYLAVARAQKAELQFSLRTILASKFKRCTRTQAVDLLFVMYYYPGYLVCSK